VEEYDAQVVMATTDTTNADTTNAAATTTAANTTTTTTTTTPVEDNVRTRGRGRARRLRRGGGCTDSHFQKYDSVDRHRHRTRTRTHTRTRTLQQETPSNNPYFQEQQQDMDNKVELVKDELEAELNPELKVPSPRNRTFYAPVWEMVPIPLINDTHRAVDIINYNLVDRPVFEKAVDYMAKTRAPTFLDVCYQSAWFLIDGNKDILQTVVAFPVFADFLPDSEVAGFFIAIIPWVEFFNNQATPTSSNSSSLDGSSSGEAAGDSNNIIIVMENTCEEIFTVSIVGSEVQIISEEDTHDTLYDGLNDVASFAPEYNRDDVENYEGEVCIYTMTIYPTKSFEAAYRTNRPAIISMMIVLIFLLTSIAFMLFDCLVTRRQAKLLNTALRQNAIVNSLFPKSVQKKLMEEAEVNTRTSNVLSSGVQTRLMGTRGASKLGTVMNADGVLKESNITFNSKPIADLFPNTTIMFGDISGFTAWSSARDPEAVFTLLETIYRAFDRIAKRRRVFKVEVVGDCYVAVCGLPDPNAHHYSVMCRFAQECVSAMQTVTTELEVTLGPDTGELMLRVGLHSGPVVAGVLRGEKSRFQLFGDTMNTAARMESTGVPNRIQVSQQTADHLIEAGKEHWIIKREEKVKAKGKGELTTYFLLSNKKSSDHGKGGGGIRASVRDEVTLGRKSDHGISSNPSQGGVIKQRVQKRNRVADWVVEMLGKLLKEMQAKREVTGIKPDSLATMEFMENQTHAEHGGSMNFTNDTVIDEVVCVLKLPVYAANVVHPSSSSSGKVAAELGQDVLDELQDYVYSIASMYNKHPFHNFEHASHVSMSCIKLLNRIAAREEDYQDGTDHTYGICNDPLTSFAIVFSALIHDVDHSGAPNVQLVREHAPVADIYKNKSVAEQNSIDVGWGLLMEPAYANLRRHIYTTVAEYKCYRQVVVNCVMATDICDKDLIQARNQRWDLAFSTPNNGSNNDNDNDDDGRITSSGNSRFESVHQVNNRKGTVVIEHLMQLSDVAHTMQHWHIYRRWNERLFEESYVAYSECRADKNPAENWYQGELGFYDFYIIPLATKIKQCQVFGVSSDEYLSYALQNRAEWEARGKGLTEEMAKKMETIHHAGLNRQLMALEMEVPISFQSMTLEGDDAVMTAKRVTRLDSSGK